MTEENKLIPIDQIERMAIAFVKSDFFGVKTIEQAVTLMLIAQAEGLHPAIAARDYDIIQGRPAKKSGAMLGSFLTHGGKVEWHQMDDTVADATFSHPAGGSVRVTWDLKRAAQADLAGKEMYKKYPRQMLRSRTISEGVRTVCPMATSGMYVPEEVQDFDAPKNVTPGNGTKRLNAIVEKQAPPPASNPIKRRAKKKPPSAIAEPIQDEESKLEREAIQDEELPL